MALTYASIIRDAKQAARCNGYDPQAGDFLNEHLLQLAQTYDLPESQQLISKNIGPLMGDAPQIAQPFQWYTLPLPNGAKYNRTKEVFYNVQGTIFWINQLLPEQYDQLFQGSGISNYPYWYVVDTTASAGATPIMGFYPPPNVSLTVFIRVQYEPADEPNPANSNNVPWFKNRLYLVTKTAAYLMMLTGDSRKAAFDSDATAQLDKYLMKLGDKDNVATRVKLDPLMFRAKQALSPTKTTGF